MCAAALAFGAAAPGAADDSRCGGADAIGGALAAGIPDDATVALIPFGPPHGAVPAGAAGELYAHVRCALVEASGGRHVFSARDLFDAKLSVWQGSDLTEFMARQEVDVTVLCRDDPAPAGVRLSCAAAPAHKGSPLAGDVPAPRVEFAVADRYFPYEYAVSRLAHALAADARKTAARDGAALAEAFVAGPDGPASALSSNIAKRANRVARGVLRPRGGGDPPALELRGALARLDGDTLELQLDMRVAGGDVVAEGVATLQRAWLPPYLAEGAGLHRAEARAVEGPGFGRAAARRAAANLARARLVAAALGLEPPGEEARSVEDGVEALRWLLERGVPFDESREWRGAEPGVHTAALAGGAVAVGAAARPGFSARLKQAELRPGDRLEVELAAEEAVRAAVFFWGADEKVWRLFPNPAAGETAALPAGGRAVVPHEKRCPVRVGLPEGSQEDLEVVVAVAVPPPAAPDFEKLAPPLCYDPRAPMPEAVPAAGFLDELAALPLERAAVVALPFAVRAAE